MDRIELSDIRTTYSGKKVPKGRRKKLITAVIADGDYLLQREREAEEKERVESKSKGNRGTEGCASAVRNWWEPSECKWW